MSSNSNSNSRHEVALEGFDVEDYMVQPAASEALQLVLHHEGGRNTVFPSPGSIHIQDSININSGIASIDRGRAEKPAAAGGTSCTNPKPSKKKKGGEGSDHHQFTTAKKSRLIWTAELHQTFVEAYNSSTTEKAVPKRILEYMRNNGFPNITRENVASHLQKYRLYLKKLKGNSSKPSRKSVPLNVTKESNFKPSSPSNQTYSNSSSSSSSCPTVCPNAHFPPPTLTQHETLLNQPIEILSQFDQTYHLDQINMVQPSFNHVDDNIGWDVHGISSTGFQNSTTSLEPAIWPNMINVLESQENTTWTKPFSQPQPEPIIGKTSKEEASDFSVRIGLFDPPILSHHQFNNIDSNGFHHMNTSQDWCNDYFLGSLPNFTEDYTMNFENLQVDCEKNVYCLQRSYSDALEFGYPIKNEVGQVFQTIIYPPGNHPDDASTLPQTFENPWEEQGQHLKKKGEGSK